MTDAITPKAPAMHDDSTRTLAAMSEMEAEVRQWRRAHPDASFTEIEQVLDDRWRAVRAGLLVALAGEDAATPRCPDCGGQLVRRGTHTRTLWTQGDRPVALTRSYATCPACGTGLSPLDERLGLRARDAVTPWLVASVVWLGTLLPFAQVPPLLAHFTGVTLSAETVRRLTEAAGAAQVVRETVAVTILEQTVPDPPVGPPVQLLSVDGAMVPLVAGD